MNDTDRVVAATFAAAMIGRIDNPTLDDFFIHYAACLKEMLVRDEAAKEVEIQRLAVWSKSGLGLGTAERRPVASAADDIAS